MSTAEGRAREGARRCRIKAARAHLRADKADSLGLAAEWRALAEDYEKTAAEWQALVSEIRRNA